MKTINPYYWEPALAVCVDQTCWQISNASAHSVPIFLILLSLWVVLCPSACLPSSLPPLLLSFLATNTYQAPSMGQDMNKKNPYIYGVHSPIRERYKKYLYRARLKVCVCLFLKQSLVIKNGRGYASNKLQKIYCCPKGKKRKRKIGIDTRSIF